MSINNIVDEINTFVTKVEEIEMQQQVAIKTRQTIENNIKKLTDKVENDKDALDIASHAIEILRAVSDEAVQSAYDFLAKGLNASLSRMFENTTRKIELKESTFKNQYPQLELELTVANGKKRSLKSDSGHGIAQIVSLLSILSLIVITNSRRILIMDEILSGLSVNNRKIVDTILWSFTQIGFQFIVNEHGFVPAKSRVYHLEMVGDVSHVKDTYIEEKGIYLQNDQNLKYTKEMLDADRERMNNEEEYDEHSIVLNTNYETADLDDSVISI